LIEVGSGKVLSGLAKRIASDTKALSLNSPADIEAFVSGPQASQG
jgi:[acyl-carrier-protein] S-malonyltransferase